ncbi:unnamed protein product [Meloidogyne enterolobii]|uniref:Uncharacterized protein n=1 Tax=Meloidogyne enterolobii TaxID=390850 RepID=A0ACB1B4Z8_MELEN
MALYSNQLSLSSENLVAKKKPKKRSLLRIIWTIVRIVLLAIVIAVIAQLTWSFIIFSGVFNNALFKIYSGNGGYFYKFEKEYNRVWKNDRERLERLKVFEENCRKIEELNEEAVERGKNVTYGINSMTDMTDQEFKKVSEAKWVLRSKLLLKKQDSLDFSFMKQRASETILSLKKYFMKQCFIVG